MSTNVQWSFSRLDAYKSCGKKYFHMTVAKDVPFVETGPMRDGKRVHKAIELRLKDGTPLPADLIQLEPMLKILAGVPGELFYELQVAFTEYWEETGFFDYNVASRFIYDFAIKQGSLVSITDWKTGKRSVNVMQLSCFALSAFKKWHDVDTVHAQFVWTKTGEVDPITYHRDDVPRLTELIMRDVETLKEAYASNHWPKKKHYCSNCEVKKAGKCEGIA